MTRLAINLLAFQVGWFSCVLGAANGFPVLGPIVVAIVVVLHLALAKQPRRELVLIMVAAILGVAFDSALVRSGWLTYSNGIVLAGSAPYWIVAMWMSFATTLNVSLRWLRGRVFAAAAFGAIGGPLSYFAGSRLGALEFINQGAALTVLGAGWALATPVLVALAERFDGVQAPDRTIAVRQHA
jgi:hypothetical protein